MKISQHRSDCSQRECSECEETADDVKVRPLCFEFGPSRKGFEDNNLRSENMRLDEKRDDVKMITIGREG